MEENKKKEYEARAQRCKIKADDILIDDFASTLIRDYNLPASLKGISDAITKWAFEFSDIPFIEYWEKFLHDEIKERESWGRFCDTLYAYLSGLLGANETCPCDPLAGSLSNVVQCEIRKL